MYLRARGFCQGLVVLFFSNFVTIRPADLFDASHTQAIEFFEPTFQFPFSIQKGDFSAPSLALMVARLLCLSFLYSPGPNIFLSHHYNPVIQYPSFHGVCPHRVSEQSIPPFKNVAFLPGSPTRVRPQPFAFP